MVRRKPLPPYPPPSPEGMVWARVTYTDGSKGQQYISAELMSKFAERHLDDPVPEWREDPTYNLARPRRRVRR